MISTAAVARGARADGLIFQLPPAGTTAEFARVAETERTLVSKVRDDITTSQRESAQSVTVSSVGELVQADQKCRWIELKRHVKPAGEARKSENILKVLVPEQFLTRGEDPLDHAILTFFNPKPVDEKGRPVQEGFNRIQYVIDRFRPVFPARLESVKTLPKETIETQAGEFADCEILAGNTEFDRPLLGDARSTFKGDWEIAIHPDAPFGVVQIRCRSESREINNTVTTHLKNKLTLTLARIGTGAKSELPSKPENKVN